VWIFATQSVGFYNNNGFGVLLVALVPGSGRAVGG
jgi:hypothetical protein